MWVAGAPCLDIVRTRIEGRDFNSVAHAFLRRLRTQKVQVRRITGGHRGILQPKGRRAKTPCMDGI